jgi:hypothetical protein
MKGLTQGKEATAKGWCEVHGLNQAVKIAGGSQVDQPLSELWL